MRFILRRLGILGIILLLAGSWGIGVCPGDTPKRGGWSEWTTGKGGDDWLTGVALEGATVRYRNLELLNGYDPANAWWVTSGGVMRPLSSKTIKQAVRFTAPWTKKTLSAGLQTCQSMGGGSLRAKKVPIYRLGIQADVNGLPSGKWLGSGTIMPVNGPPGGGYAQGKAWHYAGLDRPVMLKDGKVYHIVVQWESGRVDKKNYARFYAFTPGNRLLPFNTGGADPDVNFRDPNLTTLLFDRGKWLPEPNKRFTPVFIIKFADGTAHGQPYIHNYCVIYERSNRYKYPQPRGMYAAQFFKVHNVDKTVTHFATPACTGRYGRPDDHLYYEIQDQKKKVLRKGVLIRKDEPKSWKWREVKLSSPLKLEKGHTYKIMLTSGMKSGAYLIEAPNQYEVPQGAEPYVRLTYGGPEAYFMLPRLVGYQTREINRNMSFKFKLKEVLEGTATSVVRDMGLGKTWQRIMFEGKVPEKTSVDLYFKKVAGTTWRPEGKWILVKQGADSGTVYPIPAEAGGHHGQWRLILKTKDAAITPEVKRVTVLAADSRAD